MTRHGEPGAETWQCRNCGAALAADATACTYCTSPVGTSRCPRCLQVGRAEQAFCTRCGERLNQVSDSAATGKSCPSCRHALVGGRAGDLALASCERCGGVWLDRETFARLCREGEAQAALMVGPWAQSTGSGRTNSAPPSPKGTVPARRDPPPRAASPRYRQCPVCGVFMNRSNFARCSGVILDTCARHGTFFDARELPLLVAFLRDGGMDRAREREREGLREEQRRLSALRRISPPSTNDGFDEVVFRESTLDVLLRELFRH